MTGISWFPLGRLISLSRPWHIVDNEDVSMCTGKKYNEKSKPCVNGNIYQNFSMKPSFSFQSEQLYVCFYARCMRKFSSHRSMKGAAVVNQNFPHTIFDLKKQNDSDPIWTFWRGLSLWTNSPSGLSRKRIGCKLLLLIVKLCRTPCSIQKCLM